jgi:hypothetical protein
MAAVFAAISPLLAFPQEERIFAFEKDGIYTRRYCSICRRT